MVDRRRVLRAILLGTAGLAAPAACGLPTGGPPIIDGPGPAPALGGADANLPALTPQSDGNPKSLVQDFLSSVAGKVDTDPDVAKAGERAKEFLASPFKESWQPGTQITVVRVGNLTPSAGPNASTYVDTSLVPVGILRTDGTVGAVPGATVPQPVTMRFTVVSNSAYNPGAARYYINKIETISSGPQLTGMLLDSNALTGGPDSPFTPQLIYFWSTDPTNSKRHGLVPDLRYVPQVGQLTSEIKRTEIVNWVLAGPSDLLSSAVVSNLYAGVSLIGPNLEAPDSDGLLINLSAPPPQGVTIEQVVSQLRWSLRGLYNGPVRLQVNSQNQQSSRNISSDRWERDNLANAPGRTADPNDYYPAGEPTAYCVAGGVVRSIQNPDQPPSVLRDTSQNRNVRYAALRSSPPAAALVKTDNRLYIGTAAAHDDGATYTLAKLSGTAWTRPAFLPTNDSDLVIVVAVDGHLYGVDKDGNANVIGVDGNVSAFSIAPDGHRIALIVEGAACVGGLRFDGNVSLGTLRTIDSGLTELTGIAWSRLDRVLIAGRATANYQLCEASIDGAVADPWVSAAYAARITSVAALPHQPSGNDSMGTGWAMVQTENSAYHARSNSSDPIRFATPDGSPSPTASSGGAPASLGVPSNPFYPD